MPDKRVHRGPHPEDATAFSPEHWPAIRTAVHDLSWLLSRDYSEKSALALVGDRFCLTQRQRLAVMRCSCSDAACLRRRQTQVASTDIAEQPLLLDGYNILTTVEAALSGGIIIQGRDGCWRDMASMHGTFRQVNETIPAIRLIARALTCWRVGECRWYLDSPVSNSGRLKVAIGEVATELGLPWSVAVVIDPDAVLAGSQQIIATADSVVLDRCCRWFNLSREALSQFLPNTPVIDLSA